MSEILSHDIEHNFLESDMRRLAAEVKEHRGQPENTTISEEALIKKALVSISSAPIKSRVSTDDPASPLPSYAQELSSEMKLEIEYLLDLAFHVGIEKANEAAKQSGPFIVDAFHDALVGRLYPELQKKGIVK